MSIEAHVVADFDELCDLLSTRIGDARESPLQRVFGRTTLIVPTQHHARWIELAIARRNGIASGLQFLTIHDLFRRSAEAAGARILDRTTVRNVLLDLFLEEPGSVNLPAPVQSYVHSVPDEKAIAVRAVGLADKLSSLYAAYALTRPEWLADWEASPPDHWQGALWNEVIRRVRGVEPFLTHAEAAAAVGTDLGVPELLVVGLQSVDSVTQVLLRNLAKNASVSLLLTSPAFGDWSSLTTGRLDEAHIPDVAPAPEWNPSDENPMLRLWGRTGRDLMWRLGQMCSVLDFSDRPENDGETTLAEVQSDIRTSAAEHSSTDLPVDGSIQLFSAPGARRELEAVANDIWTRLLADPDLRLADFAVVMPDGQAAIYTPQLLAAFAGARRLPVNLVGAPAGSTNQVIDAARRLVQLPLGDLRRSQLLALMIHPNVIAGFPDADREKWLRWASELTILRGADHDAQSGSFVERDLYNWDQGLRRLALGAAMRDVGEPVSFGEHDYLPPRVSESDVPIAADFVMLGRSLVSDATWAAAQQLTLSEWADVFADFVDVYLRPAETETRRAADEQVMSIGRCRMALRQLGDADLLGTRVPFPVAAQLATSLLNELEAVEGDDFLSGVVVGTPGALRCLPFRHVYRVGMADDAFPRRSSASPLDLRAAHFCRGDVSAEDADRYTFLEFFMQATDSFNVSWVGRDPKTGEELQPSATVSELLDELRRRGVSHQALVRDVSLRRYYRPAGAFPNLPSEPGAPQVESLHREAFREAQLRSIHEDLKAFCETQELPLPDAHTLATVLADKGEAGARLLDLLHFPTKASRGRVEAAAGEPKRITLTLRQLQRFLESPLQAGADINLGLYSDSDDPLVEEHEPFQTAHVNRVVMLREVFFEALMSPLAHADLGAIYDERAAYIEELRGAVPTGLFNEGQRRVDMKELTLWAEFVGFHEHHATGFSRNQRVEFFGFGEHDAQTTQQVAPLEFTMALPNAAGGLEPVTVELRGKTAPVSQGRDAILFAAVREGSKLHDFIPGYLAHLMLAALVDDVPRPRVLGVVFSKAYKSRPHRKTIAVDLAPVAAGDARAQLERLCKALLSETHDYLFPLEAVDSYVSGLRDDPAYPYEAALTAALRRWGGRFRYGPIKRLDAFGPPNDPRAMLAERFRYFAPLEVPE